MPRPGYQKKCGASHPLSRRTVLKSMLGVGLGLQFAGSAVGAAKELRRARPQVSDFLVFSLGERQGQLITPQDLPLVGPAVIAYPMDPGTQTVRDGSRLNAVLLVRFAQEELSEPTRAVAAEGIVGYSAVCTHAGCDVSGWKGESECLTFLGSAGGLSSALQFPFGQPAVTAIIPGARSVAELQANLSYFEQKIPADFWAELKHLALIDPTAPVLTDDAS